MPIGQSPSGAYGARLRVSEVVALRISDMKLLQAEGFTGT
jgi:hypothetical protein